MAEVGIEILLFRAGEVIVDRKLRRRRADLILQAERHHNFRLYGRSKVFYIKIGKLAEKLLFPLMARIRNAEKPGELFISGAAEFISFSEIRQKGICHRSLFHFREERGSYQR